MESEDEEYDEENEEDKYDEMEENEFTKILGEPHPHNVPNENNNLQHDNNDPEDSEETGLHDNNDPEEDENANNNEDSEEEEEEEVIKNEASPSLGQSNRVRTPNPSYQHLSTSNIKTKEVYT